MYLPPQVIFHQIYIILHHLPSQIYQGEEKNSNDSQTRWNSEFQAKLAKFILCAVPLILCATLFQGQFWKASRSPNQVEDNSLEILVSLLSRTTWISEFGVHFPLQKLILPRLLPVWQKSGREGTFWVFFALLETQNLSKILRNFWASIFFHADSKNIKFFANGCLQQKRSASGAAHLLEKPVFYIKNSKLTKISPNFLKFGMIDPC